MEIRKERTIIKIYDDEKLTGGWDILYNNFIGQKGQVLKGISAPFMRNLDYLSADGNTLATHVKRTLDGRAIIGIYHFDKEWEQLAPFIESLLSVGISPAPDYYTWSSICGTDNYPTLNKSLVHFIKYYYEGVYSPTAIESYKITQKYTALFAKIDDVEHVKWAISVLDLVKHLPIDWVTGMCLRAIHEKVYCTTEGDDFGSILNHWAQIINETNDKLEVCHNILTNYTILRWTYEEYKKAHYDDILNKFNNCGWLYFEDDDYIVRPLLTRQDFHIEATVQQNCVERWYMERVAKGTTHVVSVRKKSQPNIPYITCEVDNEHRIIQYLARFNHAPNNRKDYDFKVIYRDYLLSSLSNE